MMRRLVLASSNAGKIREINRLLAGLGYEARPQSELGVHEIAETGATFLENAMLKARNAARQAALPAIADDSGIEVDALHGAPGVHSARYAGEGASDAANVHKLLTELRDVPEARRVARFRCVLVYLRHALDAEPIVCHGTWDGRILTEARGANGFGYDPVFFVPTQRCSAAELPPETKNTLSHRGQALRALLARLTLERL